MILLFAFGIKQITKSNRITVLMALTGIGLMAAGIFTTDPVFGFPEDLPFTKKVFTLHGKLHTWFSLLVFLGTPVNCFLLAKYFGLRKVWRWKYYSLATGIIMLSLFFITGIAFNQLLGLGPVAGLLQRLCVISGFGWISMLAIWLNTSANAASIKA